MNIDRRLAFLGAAALDTRQSYSAEA